LCIIYDNKWSAHFINFFFRPFSSEKNVENPTAMFNYIQNQMEIRVWQKDLLNKYLGRIGNKKPLWIVESGNRDRRGDFADGLNWAQRLCAGARVGINTIFRKPSLLSLNEPTPVSIIKPYGLTF